MSRTPRDESLDQALARLPRQPASEGFTLGVLLALDQRGKRRRWRPAAAARILLALLVAATALAVGVHQQRQRASERAYQRRVEELRTEYRQLLEEIALMRHEAAGRPALVYFGGADRLDLLVDLARPRPAAMTFENQPASLEAESSSAQAAPAAHKP